MERKEEVNRKMRRKCKKKKERGKRKIMKRDNISYEQKRERKRCGREERK